MADRIFKSRVCKINLSDLAICKGLQYFLTDSSSIWSIKDDVGNEMLTSYGTLAGPNKWTEVGTRLLGNSISNTAQWIGLGTYPGQGISMTASAKFTAPSAVPVPGTVFLLGSGLLGLVGLRRSQAGRSAENSRPS